MHSIRSPRINSPAKALLEIGQTCTFQPCSFALHGVLIHLYNMIQRVLKDAWQGANHRHVQPLSLSPRLVRWRPEPALAQPVGLDDKLHDFLPRPYPVTQQASNGAAPDPLGQPRTRRDGSDSSASPPALPWDNQHLITHSETSGTDGVPANVKYLRWEAEGHPLKRGRSTQSESDC